MLGGHLAQRRVVLAHEGRSAVRREVVEDFALAAPDPFGTSESLEVGAADVGQQPVVGFGDRAEPRQLAAGAGSHLHDAEGRFPRHGEQRQRHADVVVEVPVRGVDGVALRQHAAHELLGRGLAAAPRDGEDRNPQHPAVRARQLLKGLEGVADKPHAAVAGRRAERFGMVGHGRRGPLVEGLRHEAVPVEVGPVEGKKDRTRLDAPGVGRNMRVFPEKFVK